MSEFLLEIFCEEIPARMQLKAAENLKGIVSAELAIRQLSFSQVNTLVTPRRLTVVAEGLPSFTLSTAEDRRGPKIGAPEAALQGFLKSAGVKRGECLQRDGYYYASLQTPPLSTDTVLPEIIHTVFAKMSWPKSMVWALKDGQKSQPWIRPVRSILAIYKGKILCFDLPTLGLKTGNKTFGHRFLAPDALEVSSFADYQEKLKKAFVVLNHKTRQDIIWERLTTLAAVENCTVMPDKALLEEVAGLVEYPVPLLGCIDAQFMSLPPEVLSTSMRVHQKYFTLVDRENNIAPFFGVVANQQGSDNNTAMIAGYERVLRARLSDAAFFYKTDINIPLETLKPKLDNIIFHTKLGNVGQKVKRLIEIAPTYSSKRAADLCKSDLLTHMVDEFPELQGIMGRIYAMEQGEKPEVADAIRDHYLPKGAHDKCPTEECSIYLALIDKMDTLIGFFGMGEKPTGSKDPFALRRAALGIIRLFKENNWNHPYNVEGAYRDIYRAYEKQEVIFKENIDTCVESVRDFINDRLKTVMQEEGIRYDYSKAVIEGIKLSPYDSLSKIKREDYNVCALSERMKALQTVLNTPEGQDLLFAYRRANGILQGEQNKDGNIYSGSVSENLLNDLEEREFFKVIQDSIFGRSELLMSQKYEKALSELAKLSSQVNDFFKLQINHPTQEIRRNRLELLRLFTLQTDLIADFSVIEA